MELSKKHKTFEITHLYRGIEVSVLCVTTSKKKFAELLNESVSHIHNYSYSYDLRYPICNENPEVLYAKVGLGGEGTYIFKRDEIKPLSEFYKLIDEHRKQYTTYKDYLKKNKL